MLKKRIARAKKTFLLLQDAGYRRGLRQGIGAAIEHRHQLAGLHIATVVDVGANKGQFSLLTRSLFPEAKIFAFEPLARPAGKFRALFTGDEKVRLFQIALGPAAAKQAMHVSANDDSSSLLPISELQIEFAPGTQEVAMEEVAMFTLEGCVSVADIVAPALLKLDVQGFELEVLKGCESVLDRFVYVYAELSFVALYEGQALAHEVIGWLQGRDFHVCGAANPAFGRDGKIVQMDMLFRCADTQGRSI